MRVEYVTEDALPQLSLAVTVTVALHVPTVVAVFVSVPGQSSVAVVAAIAAV